MGCLNLAEYVLENNGADITSYTDMPELEVDDEETVSRKPAFTVEVEDAQEAAPYIQIFRDGREL